MRRFLTAETGLKKRSNDFEDRILYTYSKKSLRITGISDQQERVFFLIVLTKENITIEYFYTGNIISHR